MAQKEHMQVRYPVAQLAEMPVAEVSRPEDFFPPQSTRDRFVRVWKGEPKLYLVLLEPKLCCLGTSCSENVGQMVLSG